MTNKLWRDLEEGETMQVGDRVIDPMGDETWVTISIVDYPGWDGWPYTKGCGIVQREHDGCIPPNEQGNNTGDV